ncbi:MAG: hypothetical protein JWN50_782 [Parcubacteria group bacterium]|nr:hypothetical protein [Parcubacteria group bacterium]
MARKPSATARLRQIEARKRFLLETVNLSLDLLEKRGRQTKYEQGSSHTNVGCELKNFSGFDFESDLGQTMMGGNDLTITYHGASGPRTVLKVYWQNFRFDPEDCTVNVFAQDQHWQRALIRTLAQKDRIIEKTDRAEKKQADQARAAREKAAAACKTDELATRLLV